MQKRRLLFFLNVLILLFCSTWAYAQDLPSKDSLNFPIKQDTTLLSPKDTLQNPEREISTVVADTVKVDSIFPQKELLSDIVEYYGEDYVYIDRKAGKVYMYNQAFIIYEKYRIDAGLIILNYNKNEVYAKGIDSAGVYSQRPVFAEGNNIVEPDSIRFNFDTKKAIVYNSRTKQNEMNVLATVTKKENDSVYYLNRVKFTTAEDIDNPEYYFYARKVKLVPKKKVVSGFINMYIADVPTPVGLPFAFFLLLKIELRGL